MEKAAYTHRQMLEMMHRTKSWTLNNPSGPLPYLPVIWQDQIDEKTNFKTMHETLPPYKKPHVLIKFLMWCKVI